MVKTCCQLGDGEQQPGDHDKLASVSQPEWSCWKTGVELSCFGVKLLRVCELEGLPFYGASGMCGWVGDCLQVCLSFYELLVCVCWGLLLAGMNMCVCVSI